MFFGVRYRCPGHLARRARVRGFRRIVLLVVSGVRHLGVDVLGGGPLARSVLARGVKGLDEFGPDLVVIAGHRALLYPRNVHRIVARMARHSGNRASAR